MRKPSPAYSRVFSGLIFGTLFFVSGLIGYRLDHHPSPLLAERRWTGAPIMWQVALGAGFLLMGAYSYRRLSPTRWAAAPQRERRVKNVGRGKSAGAAGYNPAANPIHREVTDAKVRD